MGKIFFTSTGRTGTDFFTYLFNEYISNAWSLHEPHPAFRERARKNIRGDFNLYDKIYFKYSRLLKSRKRSEKWYVETNYHLFASIPLIRQAFPNSIVVHIVRDGRDVVSSWLNRYRYITNDHIRPEDCHDKSVQNKWENWNPLQKLAWYWKKVNMHAISQKPNHIFRFEDIFKEKNPNSIFSLLDEMDGIEYSKSQVEKELHKPVNKNKVSFFPGYEEWPGFWKDQFWEIAGDEMKRLNYK